MRRSLVLGDESAHHPFLQTLPPHVRADQPVPARAAGPMTDHKAASESGTTQDAAADWLKRHAHAAPHMAVSRLRHWRKSISMQDLRDFLLAYCACFVAVMAFIA